MYAHVQFLVNEVEEVGDLFLLETKTTTSQLHKLTEKVCKNTGGKRYFVNDVEVETTLHEALKRAGLTGEEKVRIRIENSDYRKVGINFGSSNNVPGHNAAVLCLAFSPDSGTLATGSGDATGRTWDLNMQLPRRVLGGHKHWITAISFSPCGKYVLTGDCAGSVSLWENEKHVHKYCGHNSAITSIAWQPLALNESAPYRFATASRDRTARIWSTGTTTSLGQLPHDQSVMGVRWGFNDVLYTACKDGCVRAWREGAFVAAMKRHLSWVNCIALTTDGLSESGPYLQDCKPGVRMPTFEELLVTGGEDSMLYVWSCTDHTLVHTLRGHSSQIFCVTVSADGLTIASGSADGTARLWSVRTGALLATIESHVKAVYVACFSSCSTYVATAGADGVVHVTDRNGTPKTVLSGSSSAVYALGWSKNGRFIACGGQDGLVRMWRT